MATKTKELVAKWSLTEKFNLEGCLLWQVERNLHDAMNVARNVMLDPRLVPGGGAAEMALAHVRLSSTVFNVL